MINALKLFICVLFVGSWPDMAFATKDSLNIHVNVGQVKTVDSSNLYVKCFNPTSSFEYNGQVFKLGFTDSLVLQLFNHDSLDHEISIEPFVKNVTVKSQAMTSVIVLNITAGDYRIKDLDETQSYLGLSGMLHVTESNLAPTYFWNLKEFHSSFNEKIKSTQTVDFTQYSPNYFLINGKSFPDVESDTQAKIKGYVNDTLYLTMLNSGQSIHPIHFHGFHFKVVYSSLTPEAVGRIKDTYGLWSGELITLEMVPDKPGEYPVHSHNLVSVSANNIYPNGMFTTMVIRE
jgi:FtsP/CotA-like multicopper oxidase with cupredoxin domain